MDTRWEEALDLGDSDDLPPLRPFQTQNHHKTISTSTAAATSLPLSQPFLQRCSLPSQSDHPPPEPNPTSTSSSSSHLIPGPAGSVQAAMNRRKNNKSNEMMGLGDEDPIPTQEYIKRAVEEPGADDDDFTRDPWLCAVDFVLHQGLVDGDGAIGIPLSAIKSQVNVDKVAQVVAIVKSCIPNGLGDMMVTLKDPTGTMDASIHRRVLTEGEFGKDISIGAVIIIQKAVVFSPSRSARYLNITLGNVVKVISKDSITSLKENCSASTSKYAAPGSEHSAKSQMPQKSFSLTQGRTQGIMNSLRQNANMRGSAHDDELMEVDRASYSDGSNRNQSDVSGKEHLMVRQDVASRTMEVAAETKIDNNEKVETSKQLNPWNQAKRGNILEGAQYGNAGTDFVEASNNQENGNNSGTTNRQPSTLRASLPQWTDEQLDELFAID